MSLENIKTIKKTSFFKPWDIVAYALLLLCIVIMFWVTISHASNAGKIDHLEIRYDGKVAGIYSFTKQNFTAAQDSELTFEYEVKEGHSLLTIMQQNGEKNILEIDRNTFNADMVYADCSRTHDCTYMHIRSAMDSIICIPHRLVILPIADSQTIPGEVIIG